MFAENSCPICSITAVTACSPCSLISALRRPNCISNTVTAVPCCNPRRVSACRRSRYEARFSSPDFSSVTERFFTLLYLPIILLGVFPMWFGWSGLVGAMLGGVIGGAFVEGLGFLGGFRDVLGPIL